MAPSQTKRSSRTKSSGSSASTSKKPRGCKTCSAVACDKPIWGTTEGGKNFDSKYCRNHSCGHGPAHCDNRKNTKQMYCKKHGRCQTKGCKVEIKKKLEYRKWYCHRHRCTLKDCHHSRSSKSFCEYHKDLEGSVLVFPPHAVDGPGFKDDGVDSSDRSETYVESDESASMENPRRRDVVKAKRGGRLRRGSRGKSSHKMRCGGDKSGEGKEKEQEQEERGGKEVAKEDGLWICMLGGGVMGVVMVVQVVRGLLLFLLGWTRGWGVESLPPFFLHDYSHPTHR